MNYKAVTHVGLVRKNNEDSFFASENPDFPLFIIADGIGGENFGELASSITVDVIKRKVKNLKDYSSINDIEKDFIDAISEANKEVLKRSLEDENYSGMGSTVTVAYVYNDSILFANAGDSRAYAINNKEIIQLTEDDSVVNDLYKMGEITKEETKNHPRRNIITNAVGTEENIDISLVQYNYGSEEYILLCTDGLSDLVSDERIFEIVNENPLDEISILLLDEALKNGGNDNISFIIFEVGDYNDR